MKDDGVVIVGGGLAAQRCAEGLRRRGYEAPVRIVCAEPEPPYDRPPLSKAGAGGSGRGGVGRLPARLVVRGERRSSCCSAPGPSALDPAARDADPRLRRGARLREAADRDRRRPAPPAVPRALRERPLPAHPRRRPPPAGRAGRRAPAWRSSAPASSARRWRRRRARLGVEVTMIEALETPLAPILGDRARRLVRRAAPRRGRAGDHRRDAGGRPRRAAGSRSWSWPTAAGSPATRSWSASAPSRPPAGSPAAASTSAASASTPPAARRCRRSSPPATPRVPFDPRFGVHARTEHWDAAAWQGAAVAKAMLGEYPGTPPLPSFWSDQYGLRIQSVGHPHHGDAVVIEGDPAARDFEAVLHSRRRPGRRASRSAVRARSRRFASESRAATGSPPTRRRQVA